MKRAIFAGLLTRTARGPKSVAQYMRVARIWKRGGLFLKSEKCANDLDPNFHCSWISFTRFVRKLRRNFSESSEIQRFFPPKIRKSGGLQKRKKGLHLNWDWFFGRNRKFKRFFRPKSGGLQKKKKGLHRIWDGFFGPNRKSKRLRGGCFPMGGAIFNFSQKIGLKTTKKVRFCILHKPMGGARAPPPPPPGYATGPGTAPAAHPKNITQSTQSPFY